MPKRAAGTPTQKAKYDVLESAAKRDAGVVEGHCIILFATTRLSLHTFVAAETFDESIAAMGGCSSIGRWTLQIQMLDVIDHPTTRLRL